MEEFEMADAGKSVTVQYFYKIRWGFQDEFVELFERNHWPLLKAQLESGRLLDVRAYEPRFHGDGRQDWTFEVTITYRDWPSMEEHTDPAIVRRLYPDAERLKREEQRRFELIEAHWIRRSRSTRCRGSRGRGPMRPVAGRRSEPRHHAGRVVSASDSIV